MNKKKILFVLIVAVVLIGVLVATYLFFNQKNQMSNFDECVKAGNSILESFPRQCVAPDGRVFIEGENYPECAGPGESCGGEGGIICCPGGLACEKSNDTENDEGVCVETGIAFPDDICVDKCGDGQCQEIVCMGEGCPCSETPENCPEDCVSESYPTGLPNPASVNCEVEGGTLKIREGSEGGQTGFCVFDNGSECEEWDFYNGDCQPSENMR